MKAIFYNYRRINFTEVIMIALKTQRLYLRNVISNDAETIFDYRNHKLCNHYQRGQTRDYKKIIQLIEHHKNDEISITHPFMIAVALNSNNEMIGEINVIPKEHTISIGYTFSYKYHRQGYAYEALSKLIELLHLIAPDWEFISFTDPDNIASIRLLLKLGYKNLGYIPSIQSQAFGKWTTSLTDEEFSKKAK